MSGSLKEVIEPVQDKVEESLETECGLLLKLVASGVISDQQKAAVEVIYPHMFVCTKFVISQCSGIICAVFLRR